MELTYKVRGADGKEYGPATPAQISSWLAEGRISSQTEITRSDINYWAPVGSFTEFQAAAAATPPPISAVATHGADPNVEAQLRSGASWLYWIAGLSLINTISALAGSHWRFIFGLGISREAIDFDAGSAVKIIFLALNVIAIAVFIFLGVLAHKRHAWAFILGMIFLGLDGLLSLIAQDWLGVAFHAFVLFCIFRGLQACRALRST